MKTRQDYLNNKCTHREYYSQFVNDTVLSVVKYRFGIDVLKKAANDDEHLNSIPLTRWDSLAGYTQGKTLSESVCILKEAARQLIED